jgi:hypothetical protein
MLAAEKAYVAALLPFWNEVDPGDITLSHYDRYHDIAVKKVQKGRKKKKGKKGKKVKKLKKAKRFSGDRTVDLQLNTLRNALRWACRCDLMKHMPLPEGWPRYHIGSEVHHCRESMAHNADEVHKIGSLKVCCGGDVSTTTTGALIGCCVRVCDDLRPARSRESP